MTKGAGTRSSPISVEDSEEEVMSIIEIDDSSSTPPLRTPTDHLPLFHRLQQASPPPPHNKKRKRSESMIATAMHGPPPLVAPSRSSQQLPLENRLSNLRPESKKARKRRRRMERQAHETEHLMRVQTLPAMPTMPTMPVMPTLHNFSAAPPPLQSWPIPARPYSASPHMPPTRYSMDESYRVYPDEIQNPISPPQQQAGSDWVSSMVMAASVPEPEVPEYAHSEYQPPPPPTTFVPPLPSTPDLPKPFPASSLPKAPEVHGLPAKPPPPQQIIGMKPDPDPKSKHGVFTLAKKAIAANYIPNPARTLVMEQLPKTHRNADFVNTWGKNACGSPPVHVSIDSAQGKALVEFATAELARKAWASPKLGSQFAGLKPHQLRGKPREDQIKVWWYRVDGVGAGAGVGEIEEGEIEGEEIDKEADKSAPRKETKKERKARLAKEREEKRQKQAAELALKKATIQTSAAAVPNSGAAASQISQTLPVPPVPSVHPMPTLPIMPSMAYPYPSDYHQMPALPYITPSTSSLPPPPAHLPAKPLTPKREAPTVPAAMSAAISRLDDQESISSSRGGGSDSPDSRTYSGNLDDYQDMDLEGDDMEIDSPDSPVAPSLPARPVDIATPALTGSSTPASIAVQAIPTGPRIRGIQPAGIQGHHKHALHDPRVPPSYPLATSAPSHAPSEPKALRGIPSKPRSQTARSREIEERIAKELAAKKDPTPKSSISPGDTPLPPPPVSAAMGSAPPSAEIDSQLMENKLRQLVLKSKKSKMQNVATEAPGAPSSDNVVTAPPISAAPNVKASASRTTDTSEKQPCTPSNPTTVSVSTHTASLEDLAVSFITHTIQTVKAQPPPATTPPNEATMNNPKTNLELVAARATQLEQHVAESKILMAKLGQARTKQERDAIFAALRQLNRSIELISTPINEKTNAMDTWDRKGRHFVKDSSTIAIRWPETQVDAGVFIISDDDESDIADGE